MTHRNRFFLLLLVSCIFAVSTSIISIGQTLNKTKVLVIGTIHQLHSIDTNYTYYDLYNILAAYDADIVCVEIRPKDFRKELYLPEMTMATIWALTSNKKVYPIDWWRDDTRLIRDSLMKLSEYKSKEQEAEALMAGDNIITGFEKKYGTLKEQAQMGYEFWNGKEYNEYTMENYRMWMQVFGDSPITLYYRTRNDSMMAQILNAIDENPGSKVIVLTGSEHKHYFDNALERNPNVSLIQLNNMLPLVKKELEPSIMAYFDEADDLTYYEKGYPQNLNDYYRTKLISLIHGMNMDIYPESIPGKNVLIAEKVIDRWKKDLSSTTANSIIDFELGWLNFLKKDYNQAINYLLPLSRQIEEDKVDDPFLRAITHRNLGLCYDCTGQRDSAITCYVRGEEIARSTSFSRAVDLLFKNYKIEAYQPGKH